MATTAQQMRAFTGLSLFSAGFRPFYLFAATWSALMVPLWIWIYSRGQTVALRIDVAWHAHEMLFGYTSAALAAASSAKMVKTISSRIGSLARQ